MNLKIDMDGWKWPTIHHIVKHHRYLKTVIKRLGWKVSDVKVYHSASGKGRHVELTLIIKDKSMHWSYGMVMFQSIFGDDPRRALWCISRIMSNDDCQEFRDEANWNILWEKKHGKKRKFDAKGTARLKKVWK